MGRVGTGQLNRCRGMLTPLSKSTFNLEKLPNIELMELVRSQPSAHIFHLLFVSESTESSRVSVCETDSPCGARVAAVL